VFVLMLPFLGKGFFSRQDAKDAKKGFFCFRAPREARQPEKTWRPWRLGG